MSELDSVYQAIGQALLAELPEQWDVAWAVHEIAAAGGITQCKGFYQEERGGDAVSVPLDPSAHQAFSDLLRVYRSAGKPPWRLAQFTLAPGGTFEMEFAYDEPAGGTPPPSGGRTGY